MKAKFFILLIVMILLFSACNADTIDKPNTITGKPNATSDNSNITRDQAIIKVKNISNDTGDLDIKSYPEMDNVTDGIRYYFIKVVFPNRMSAEYYVDDKEGNVFVAVGGELDTSNPLPSESISSGEEPGESGEITEIIAPETDDIKAIFESIGMTAEQIKQKFGSNYSKVSVDYDGYMEGFLYSEEGFTVAFGDEGKVEYVYCSDKIEINGARSGMDFSQIQQKLGKTSIRQTWVETPINAAYEIEYSFNGRTVCFFSRQNEGSNSIMSIS